LGAGAGLSSIRITGTGGGAAGAGSEGSDSNVEGALGGGALSAPLVDFVALPDVAPGACHPGMVNSMPGRIFAGSEMLFATASSP
jgi:hypothetical protein